MLFYSPIPLEQEETEAITLEQKETEAIPLEQEETEAINLKFQLVKHTRQNV